MALVPISLVFYRADLVVKHYGMVIKRPFKWPAFPISKGYCGHSVSQKKIRYVIFFFFLTLGIKLVPFF